MSLKYPSEVGAGGSDFVTFTPMKYRSNSNGGAAPGGAGAGAITLYMPNNTPNVGNGQVWDNKSFPGPLGAAQKELQKAVATGVMGIGSSSVDNIVQDVKKNLDTRAASNFGGIAKQMAMKQVGQLTGGTPNQMLALSKGVVYNPNVELLYNQPDFRQFSFNFDFVPKSAADSQAMNQIILNFKKWSAPLDLQNGMFEVPYVWQITYHSGGGPNQFMNKFKPAACMNVSVQANQATDMHVSHIDGAPVQTSLTLLFKETDIITRKDHNGGQGY